MPVSRTAIWTSLPIRFAEIVILPPCGVYSKALPVRLVNTCTARSSSARTCGRSGCSSKSSVNYFAQGMYSAATGETLADGQTRVDKWKSDLYEGEKPSEGDYYWFEFGYSYFVQRKQCEIAQLQLEIPDLNICK